MVRYSATFMFFLLASCSVFAEFCGDGECGWGEDCNSCPEDCGVCLDQCDITVNQGPLCPPNPIFNESCEDSCIQKNNACLQDCSGIQKDLVCVASCEKQLASCLGKERCKRTDCDLLGVLLCGNGWCEHDKGENQQTCPQDCGSPVVSGFGYCGDGICGIDLNFGEENCNNCLEDCEGFCVCQTDGTGCFKGQCSPNLPLERKIKVPMAVKKGEFETPRVVGTGVKMVVSGGIDTSMKVSGEEVGQCSFELSGMGSFGFCATLVGVEKCLGGKIKADGSCKTPMYCASEDDKKFNCDKSRSTCAGKLTSELTFAQSLVPEWPFGPFKLGLKLGYIFKGAAVIPDLNIALSEPGISFKTFSAALSMSGTGGGTAKYDLFGYSGKVGLSASTCAGMSPHEEDDNDLPGEIRLLDAGAQFKLTIDPIKLGYFEVGGWFKKWEGGDGC